TAFTYSEYIDRRRKVEIASFAVSFARGDPGNGQGCGGCGFGVDESVTILHRVALADLIGHAAAERIRRRAVDNGAAESHPQFNNRSVSIFRKQNTIAERVGLVIPVAVKDGSCLPLW